MSTLVMAVAATVMTLIMAVQVVSESTHGSPSLSDAVSTFSQNLYRTIFANESNLVYSPYSLHSALAVAYYGARGKTAREIAHALAFQSSFENDLLKKHHELISQLNSAKGVELRVANAVFFHPGWSIEPDFVKELKRDYWLTVQNSQLTEAAVVKMVNDFIAKSTNNIITNVLSPDCVTNVTAMLLVNTVFFNGSWAYPFELGKTKSHIFQGLEGKRSQVRMMNGKMMIPAKRDYLNQVDVVELPIRNHRFGLYIALPQTTFGIRALERFITSPGQMKQLFEGLTTQSVRLSIPRFKIQSQFDLKENLNRMGMTAAFSNMADFSGITCFGKLSLSEVIHNAVIKVHETGVIAGAATVFKASSRSANVQHLWSFIADHPFIFFVRDNLSAQILFQGKFSG